MSNTVWFLTGNEGKLSEAKSQLGELGYEVKQLVVPGELLYEPQSGQLEVVAKSKINQALEFIPGGRDSEDMVLVEDAGLFIDSLHGFPGVYSSYVLSTIGINGILRLLSHLESVDTVSSAKLRSAHFKAVAAMWSAGEIYVGEGVCPGHIAMESVGENGFGYDPIFIPYDLDVEGTPLEPGLYGDFSTHGIPFGGVESQIKQKFSHRAKALKDLFNQLPSA